MGSLARGMYKPRIFTCTLTYYISGTIYILLTCPAYFFAELPTAAFAPWRRTSSPLLSYEVAVVQHTHRLLAELQLRDAGDCRTGSKVQPHKDRWHLAISSCLRFFMVVVEFEYTMT